MVIHQESLEFVGGKLNDAKEPLKELLEWFDNFLRKDFYERLVERGEGYIIN